MFIFLNEKIQFFSSKLNTFLITVLGIQIGGIKSEAEEILVILRQLMMQGSLSAQIKPSDELTRYSSDSLNQIKTGITTTQTHLGAALYTCLHKKLIYEPVTHN